MAADADSLTDSYGNLRTVSGITQAFRNFDDPLVFQQAQRDIRDTSAQNFVVDFGDDEAYCAFNLMSDEFDDLLRAPRSQTMHTRWINLWFPYKQKDTLHSIARNYDFSPRLLAILSSDPCRRPPRSTVQSSRSTLFRRSQRSSQKTSKGSSIDLEKVSASMETGTSQSTEPDQLQNMTNHYEVVNDVWHWSSIEWGRRFVCLGYNALYAVKASSSSPDEEPDAMQDLPEGTRVWTWLILCEDKTVITVREDPFPLSQGYADPQEHKVVLAIRRNLINVFQQLSKAHDCAGESPMTILPIRKRLGETEEETAHRPTDSPGLLFFHLFEDWYSAFNLVSRREHRYAAELNQLRECMLVKPELRHIDRLHHIGRQLGVLKRLYQSYELLIDRILEKQEVSLASLKNSNILSDYDSAIIAHAQVLEPGNLLGVSLSSAARVRFARLKHNIRLYALSEIQECLDQRDALVMMNFNLIAIKESYSVERLTRVTLVLAKVTMLFMPVSLVTGYFSTQLDDVRFNLRSYWVTFGITLAASCVGLLIFSLISGTIEGKMVNRSISRSALDASRTFLARRSIRSS